MWGGLTSLGKHPESCGIMLTPVILSKLPKEVCKNIVREYNNVEWPLDDVRGTLLKQTQIIETVVGPLHCKNWSDIHTKIGMKFWPLESYQKLVWHSYLLKIWIL